MYIAELLSANDDTYTYDENGIRTSKTVDGVTTYYNTKDGVILSQTDGTNTMYFQYDTSGTPLGFVLNGTQYFYITNQMGDVISITDAQGIELVQYEYDAWGKCVSTVTAHDNDIEIKLANINPIRYRGYYYDNETGYYYLQSRYYDSSICRFINADLPMYVLILKGITSGINSFSYCFNNSIMFNDITGTSSLSGILQFIVLNLKLVQISSPRKMYIEIRFSLNSSNYGPIKKVFGKIYCRSTSILNSKNYIYYSLSYTARGVTYRVYETTGRYNRPAKGTRVRVGWERVYLYMINGQISLTNGSSIVTIK